MGRSFIANAELEASGTPVDKLDGLLCFDGGNGCLDILWNDIPTVQEGTRHYLKVQHIQRVIALLTYYICLLWGHISPKGDLVQLDGGITPANSPSDVRFRSKRKSSHSQSSAHE